MTDDDGLELPDGEKIIRPEDVPEPWRDDDADDDGERDTRLTGREWHFYCEVCETTFDLAGPGTLDHDLPDWFSIGSETFDCPTDDCPATYTLTLYADTRDQ